MENRKQTTADDILATLRGAEWSAVTLQGGYATRITPTAATARFEPGRVVQQTRDNNGRCTRMECEYADGSRLVFRWSPINGPRYEVAK